MVCEVLSFLVFNISIILACLQTIPWTAFKEIFLPELTETHIQLHLLELKKSACNQFEIVRKHYLWVHPPLLTATNPTPWRQSHTEIKKPGHWILSRQVNTQNHPDACSRHEKRLTSDCLGMLNLESLALALVDSGLAAGTPLYDVQCTLVSVDDLSFGDSSGAWSWPSIGRTYAVGFCWTRLGLEARDGGKFWTQCPLPLCLAAIAGGLSWVWRPTSTLHTCLARGCCLPAPSPSKVLRELCCAELEEEGEGGEGEGLDTQWLGFWLGFFGGADLVRSINLCPRLLALCGPSGGGCPAFCQPTVPLLLCCTGTAAGVEDAALQTEEAWGWALESATKCSSILFTAACGTPGLGTPTRWLWLDLSVKKSFISS